MGEGQRMMRVAVLKGGRSAEREVSLVSGAQVAEALRAEGFTVDEIDTADESFVSTLARREWDVVFICLHGRFGEDGTVQGLCELLGLPYVGSGVLASALALDKAMSKHVYAFSGLPTPSYVVLERDEPFDRDSIVAAVGPVCVVKPANEGSALGVSIVRRPEELDGALAAAFRYDRRVVVETFVEGTEVTVGVLGTTDPFALPVIEIVPEHEFYDYDSKYQPGMSRHVIPARIPAPARERCQQLAVAAHRALGCRGVSRTDLIVTCDGEPYLLETNTIPGMTPTSLLPDAAKAAGIPFGTLCRMLIDYAMEES